LELEVGAPKFMDARRGRLLGEGGEVGARAMGYVGLGDVARGQGWDGRLKKGLKSRPKLRGATP